jgi:type II secretory pathway pseudopilin PulG
MNQRGVTLLETMMSLILLGGAILLVITLFHRGLGFARRSNQAVQASVLAQSVGDEIRDWALDEENFLNGWATWTGGPKTYPEFPGLSVTVEATPLSVKIPSPCSGLEDRFTDRRLLEGCVVPFAVTVSWEDMGPQSVRLVGHVQEPRRELGGIRIRRRDSLGLTIPAYETMELEAALLDRNDRPIPGVTFSWHIRPITGNATVLDVPPRDGSRGFVQHKYYYNPVTGDWGAVHGVIRIEARATYFGREIVGTTPDITLESP